MTPHIVVLALLGVAFVVICILGIYANALNTRLLEMTAENRRLQHSLNAWKEREVTIKPPSIPAPR